MKSRKNRVPDTDLFCQKPSPDQDKNKEYVVQSQNGLHVIGHLTLCLHTMSP